jgi:hypothetical protein
MAVTTDIRTDEDTLDLPGRIVLFGFDPEDVRLHVLPRSRRWRVLGAARTMGIALVLALPVTLIPPHVPWMLGVLGVGGFLSRRRFKEHFTVVGIEGSCPKCGAELSVARGHLRSPHPVPCDSCHHEGSVEPTAEGVAMMEQAED